MGRIVRGAPTPLLPSVAERARPWPKTATLFHSRAGELHEDGHVSPNLGQRSDNCVGRRLKKMSGTAILRELLKLVFLRRAVIVPAVVSSRASFGPRETPVAAFRPGPGNRKD